MKIKFKLCLMMIAVVLVVAGGIAIIELVKSSDITMGLAKQKTMYLARQRAQYWDGRINAYIKTLQTLSNVMNYYESINAAERRQQFEDTMRSVFEDETDLVRMFTVWKPNAIDGMDSRYIGRPGSTGTGQFAYALSRENGRLEVITSLVVQAVMDHITGPDAKIVSMSDPGPMKLAGKDVYCIRIIVPIINKRLNEVVGGIGCQLDISLIQPTIEQTIKNFEEVSALSIYTNNGFVLGSYVPERIGKQ
ncbi:MAG: hypothetical protein LBU85_08175, partial [Treponema sp.]|nr:hypothetical protein [Treponema sp.]